jgi:uncharacterized protein YggU (UPF0235/DUF167 family)
MAKIRVINEVPKEQLCRFLKQRGDDVELTLSIKPNAPIEKLSLRNQNELILSVAASPRENEANARVCELLAALFSIAKSQIEIISGHQARVKRIRIANFPMKKFF